MSNSKQVSKNISIISNTCTMYLISNIFYPILNISKTSHLLLPCLITRMLEIIQDGKSLIYSGFFFSQSKGWNSCERKIGIWFVTECLRRKLWLSTSQFICQPVDQPTICCPKMSKNLNTDLLEVGRRNILKLCRSDEASNKAMTETSPSVLSSWRVISRDSRSHSLESISKSVLRKLL